LNIWYVDHLSLWLDTKIFFMTVFKVLRNDHNENVGVTVIPQTETAEEFANK
ncbi:MAG: sugar transferase, partial [Clostridia bacterium]|nr:sugar transferase [Clostridia bacterium]